MLSGPTRCSTDDGGILQCSRRSRVFLAVGGEAVSKVGGHVDFRVLGVERRTTTGNEMGGRGATCETERQRKSVEVGQQPGSRTWIRVIQQSNETPKTASAPRRRVDGKGENGGRAWRGRGEVRGRVAGLEGTLSWLAMQDLVVLLSAVVDSGGEQEGVAGFVGGLAGWRRSGDSAVDKRATSEEARPLENVDRLRQPLP